MIINIDDLRGQGLALLTLAGWAVVFAFAIMAVEHGQNALFAASISALINLIPTWCTLRARCGKRTRLVIGIVAALQPCLLVFAAQGTAWQIDVHLYFFAALALITLLWDIRAIIAACGIITLYHLLVSVYAPELPLLDGSFPVKTAIHISAIVIIGAIQCWISLWFTTMMQTNLDLRQLGDDQAKQLKETRTSLSGNAVAFEAERETAARTQAERDERRNSEHAAVKAKFEQSISAVTQSVAKTVHVLERSAKGLKAIVAEAGDEAHDVAGAAQNASKAARTVAAGVAELKLSMSKIASNIGRQNQLAVTAKRNSDGGGQEIEALAQQSQAIAEATNAIVRITDQANAQSLKATIETATAGNGRRGFALAAQEVNALAVQASEAATQIDAFLAGTQTGTVGAESDFQAAESAITDMDKMARSIRYDVESHRQSADTITTFARKAAGEADAMAGQAKSISSRTKTMLILSNEFDQAIGALLENIQELDRTTKQFKVNLKVA